MWCLLPSPWTTITRQASNLSLIHLRTQLIWTSLCRLLGWGVFTGATVCTLSNRGNRAVFRVDNIGCPPTIQFPPGLWFVNKPILCFRQGACGPSGGLLSDVKVYASWPYSLSQPISVFYTYPTLFSNTSTGMFSCMINCYRGYYQSDSGS